MIGDAFLLLVFVLPIVDWVAAVILLAAGHEQKIMALTERGTVAVVLAFGASVSAILAWIRLTHTPIDIDMAIALLLVVILCLSIPALNFLRIYIRGGFGD